MATMQLRPMAMGEILDASFALLRRHAGVFFGVAIVCQGLPTGLSLYVQFNGGAPQLFWLYVELHVRSEEHTSELQSRSDLVCRLLLEKKKKKQTIIKREDEKLKQMDADQEIAKSTLHYTVSIRYSPAGILHLSNLELEEYKMIWLCYS